MPVHHYGIPPLLFYITVYRDSMKKPRISALNPVIEGLDDSRNKENNGRQSSTAYGRGAKNRKRRKLRQPSRTGSTSSLSGASGTSSGSDEFHHGHNHEQAVPMSTMGVLGLPEGNNNTLENGKVSYNFKPLFK